MYTKKITLCNGAYGYLSLPKGRKVTYGSFVVDIKDHREEKERTRLTVGGDQI
jgi:hypothetical protein